MSDHNRRNWQRRHELGVARALTQEHHAEVNRRHPGLTREYCCQCDAETGRAGRGDDSLYDDDTGDGPFCETCWEERHKP